MNLRKYIKINKKHIERVVIRMPSLIPKCLNILEMFSKYLNKDSNFMRNQFIKFFICFNYEKQQDESAINLFKEQHYFIILYLILSFEDHQNITDDMIIAIIYTFFSIIIDDTAPGTNFNYPALNKLNNTEFSNIVLQLSILLSNKIFMICNNHLFIEEWMKNFDSIIKGHYHFKEERYLLKEIKSTINKSILDHNGRSAPERAKRNIITIRG